MKVLTVFGTRPEAIKLAPLVLKMREFSQIQPSVCVTGQHRQMLDQVLDVFGITPDHDLNIMKDGQDLSYVTQAVLAGVTEVIRAEKPDWIVVQGDTTTAFAAGLAGFYEHVPVAHVEAGLRTNNILSPWPEEGNRRLLSAISRIHFAPTLDAAMNLRSENILQESIVVTGNTVIDALKWTLGRPEARGLLGQIFSQYAPTLKTSSTRQILVTLHRRENLGEKLRNICLAISEIARRDDVEIIFPVHLNPKVQQTVRELLSGRKNIHLLPPLDYLPFVALLGNSYLVITDSGGIQEEAPGLGKPVLVARDTTERPEAIDAGTAVLVGAESRNIADVCFSLLDNEEKYREMATAVNPFGDGNAALKIIENLIRLHPIE